MSKRPWIGLCLVAAGLFALGTVSCADEVPEDELGFVQGAKVPAGAGCKGLLNAVTKVCPGPACAVIERELIKHGCVVVPQGCPCLLASDPIAWWFDDFMTGLYCDGGAEYSRLSICDRYGQAVCASDLGTSSEVFYDAEVCDPCRLFPITATALDGSPMFFETDCTLPGTID